IRTASSPDERALLWKGRKGAFAAMGRVSPDYYVQDGVAPRPRPPAVQGGCRAMGRVSPDYYGQDGVVPRTKLPDVLRRIEELSDEHGLRVGNVFHAGDGNLHPLVLYDAQAGETEHARELAEAILDACPHAGGPLPRQHGVGMDKACSMPRMFSERDL